MRRDALLLAGLFAALAVFIALGPARSASDPAAGSHSSHSSGPDGALALYRWLAALGYKVERLQYQTFAPDPAADLLIVLAPRERFSREEAAEVAAWVEEGGVLLVAEGRAGAFGDAAPLLAAFGSTPGSASASPPSSTRPTGSGTAMRPSTPPATRPTSAR